VEFSTRRRRNGCISPADRAPSSWERQEFGGWAGPGWAVLMEEIIAQGRRGKIKSQKAKMKKRQGRGSDASGAGVGACWADGWKWLIPGWLLGLEGRIVTHREAVLEAMRHWGGGAG
jgi:hypothetical protein